MINGRVVRILDRQTLVLNVGTNQGVERGMVFGIYTPRDNIVDPETNAVLGEYRRLKARVEVRSVYPGFCVAAPPLASRVVADEHTSPAARGLYGGILGIGKTETYRPNLPVDSSDIEELPTGTVVRVGDTAEQIVPE